MRQSPSYAKSTARSRLRSLFVGVCKWGELRSHQVLMVGTNLSFIPLPKSVTPSRIESNADVYDFELDPADLAALDALDKGSAGAVTWNPIETD